MAADLKHERENVVLIGSLELASYLSSPLPNVDCVLPFSLPRFFLILGVQK